MPNLYVVGGCNGAGKTTIAKILLPEFLGCYEFVNADLIAAGLSPFRPEGVAIRAGRLMLERMNSLAESGVDFAFESTLASRSFVPFLKDCKARGYEIHLLYVWLHSSEVAIERVANRVLEGGHFVPDETVKRRYEAGRKNFKQLYLPLVDSWRVFDNSISPVLIAEGDKDEDTTIYNSAKWQLISAN